MSLRHVDANLLEKVYTTARDLFRTYEQPHQTDVQPRCLCVRCAVVAAAEQLNLTPEQRREVLFLLQLSTQAKYNITVGDLASSGLATVLDVYASILSQLLLFAPPDDATLPDGVGDNRNGVALAEAEDAGADDDDDGADEDGADEGQPWPPEFPAPLLADFPFVTSGGIALNPATNRLYVPINGGAMLAVIDTVGHEHITSVPLGALSDSWEPTAVAVNPQTNRVYVIHSSYDHGALSVVDGASHTVLAVAPLAAAPTDLAVNPAANRLYISYHDAERVAIIDGDTLHTVREASFNTTVRAIRANPLTNRVYVAANREGTIHVPDGASGECLARIDLDSPLFDLALDPAAARLYVVSGDLNFDFGDEVITGYHVVATDADTLDHQVRTDYIPLYVGSAGHGGIIIADASYPGIALVDAASDRPLAAWRTPDSVVGLAAHPDFRHLYALGLTNLWVLERSAGS